MKGLSITQPWASLVAIGAKRIETRSWATDYRGPVAIHAARQLPPEIADLWFEEAFGRVLREHRLITDEPLRAERQADGSARLVWRQTVRLPRGAIVAVANLHRVGRIGRRSDGAVIVDGRDLPVEGDELALGDFSAGRYGWVFTNVHPLREPIPCRGALGLWRVPAEIAERLTTGELTT